MGRTTPLIPSRRPLRWRAPACEKAWIFRKFHDQTIALLTGFIFGSLSILWPWKEAVITTFEKGEELKEKVIGYDYSIPELNAETGIALAIMIAGIVAIAAVETAAGKLKHD